MNHSSSSYYRRSHMPADRVVLREPHVHMKTQGGSREIDFLRNISETSVQRVQYHKVRTIQQLGSRRDLQFPHSTALPDPRRCTLL